MKVLDVVLRAADILGIKQGVSEFFEDGTDTMRSEAEKLLACFHLAECSLALDYIPLHAEESLYASDGRVEFSSLQGAPVRILDVKDVRGDSIAYTVYSNYIKTESGLVTIHYTYTPNFKTADEDSSFEPAFAEGLLTYGTLSEYCLGEGLVAEAAEWERKWKDLIATIYHTAKCKRLGSRRWV